MADDCVAFDMRVILEVGMDGQYDCQVLSELTRVKEVENNILVKFHKCDHKVHLRGELKMDLSDDGSTDLTDY